MGSLEIVVPVFTSVGGGRMSRAVKIARVWMIWCVLIVLAKFMMRYSYGAVVEGPYEGF